jgi:phosphonate transport system ATP-binding protein
MKKDLVVERVTKRFARRGTVLERVSFHVLHGESVGLIGGNGSGKSTILKCCLRLIEPEEGEIAFLGEPVRRLSSARLRTLRSQVGLIFQQHNLVPRLSVLTNVIHGAMGRRGGPTTWLQGLASNELRQEAMTCLEKVGLSHLAKSRAGQLSGGESQRVAIARALMQRPRFMMADEPVASLDPKVGQEVMRFFVDLTRQEGITLLFVSHDLDHALTFSDRLIGLNNGRLVLDADSCRLSKSELRQIYE